MRKFTLCRKRRGRGYQAPVWGDSRAGATHSRQMGARCRFPGVFDYFERDFRRRRYCGNLARFNGHRAWTGSRFQPPRTCPLRLFFSNSDSSRTRPQGKSVHAGPW